jgi:hypothetical protein
MYPTAIDAALAQEFVDERTDDLGERVRIVLARTPEADWRKTERARVPAAWVAALDRATVHEALADLGWPDVATIVPKTVASLHDKLAGLGVLLARGEPPSMLYFFIVDDEVIAFEGMRPSVARAAAKPARPEALTRIQRLHDGWFDFYSGDVGWMPEEEWQVIGAARPDGARLIGIASKGSALAGFEPGELGAPARVLWPDEDLVETPASVFDTIDEWIAAALAPAQSQT